jgi:hypothetical protein
VRHQLVRVCGMLAATSVLAAILGVAPAAAVVPAGTAYSVSSTPTLDGILNGPWNNSQGDLSAGRPYYTPGGSTAASQSLLFPTYTPGGSTTTLGGVTEPNFAVYPTGSSTATVPYPSGVSGTPGPLDGYCASGDGIHQGNGGNVNEPTGTDLPFSPYYFPDIVRNADGSLIGYFDWRPKDGDEAITVAKSTDGGLTWTAEGTSLEQNTGYCPTADTNDDGQGHPFVTSVAGQNMLYTLQRVGGDYAGVGLLAHPIGANTASDPLASVPASEPVGLDPNTAATVQTTVPSTGGVAIPISTLGAGGVFDSIVAGPYVDYTQNSPTGGSKPDAITCTGADASGPTAGGLNGDELTGCTAATAITVDSGDDLVQAMEKIGSGSSASPIPASASQTTGGAGGLSKLAFATGSTGLANTTTNSNALAYILNVNAPNRIYIDGHAVYCAQANANPATTKLEDCTSPTGPVTFSSGDLITGDPVTPQTAEMTTGLDAPDGIVGTVPYQSTFNGQTVPSGASIMLYTEKELNYFELGGVNGPVTSANVYTPNTGSGSAGSPVTLSTTGQTINYSPFPTTSEPLPASGSFTIYMGTTADSGTPVPVTCSGYSTTVPSNAPAGSVDLTGCATTSAFSGQVVDGGGSSNTTLGDGTDFYIGAPNAAVVPYSVLAQTGEGSNGATKGPEKLYGNNEDYTVLRAAYTTNGVNFTDLGAVSGGSTGAAPGSGAETDSYSDIANTDQQASPENSANPTTATTAPTAPTNLSQGAADSVELRWVGSRGTIVTNPNGSLGMFLSGAWSSDGDSDAFNQIFYTSSANGGQTWTVPKAVLSTDYTFSASEAQNPTGSSALDQPLGVSAYYSGRAYGPTIVQNPNGSLTMVFSGYRLPRPITAAGTSLGTNAAAPYIVGTTDPALYRNILTASLSSVTSPRVGTSGALTSSSATVTGGTTVTYTDTVTVPSPGAGTPTGTVDFTDDGAAISGCQNVALNEGSPDTATCVTAPADGMRSLSAVYSGDNNYATSTATGSEQVNAPSVSAITTSPATVPQGTLSDGVGNAYSGLTLSDSGLSCSSGAPCSWTVSTGSLPPGLSLSTTQNTSGTATTEIVGTPTKVDTASLTVTLTGGSTTAMLPLTISDVETLASGIGKDPTGMAADTTNNKVYVAATGSNKVDSVSAGANPIPKVSATVPFGAGALSGPQSLAFQGDTLFASNFLAESAAQYAFGSSTSQTDALAGCRQPEGISEDTGGGDLFVACYGEGSAGKVTAVNPGSGAVINSFALPGASTAPSGVAADGTSGDVVVADASSSKLYTVDASGTVGAPVDLPAGATPAYVAYADVSGTNFDYVADPGTGEFSVVDEANDASPGDVADIGLPIGTKPSEPYGIATNGSNTLVVSDADNARAFVYTLSSTAPYATLDYTLNLASGAVPDGVADMSVAGTNLAFIGNETGNSVSVVDPPHVTGSASSGGVPVVSGTPASDPIGTAQSPAAGAAGGHALSPAPAKTKKSKRHVRKQTKHKKQVKRRKKRARKRHNKRSRSSRTTDKHGARR